MIKLTPALRLLLAAAAGMGVANVYYAQPLLDAMSRDLGMSSASVGLVVTLTQVGYAVGLALLVPLGDLLDRRRMIAGQLALSAVMLTLVAISTSSSALLIAMTGVGFLAVVVQVLVAFAAAVSQPAERGRAVGTVTTGIVVGILLARFVSGVLADAGGWRTVYLASSASMLCMAVILLGVLPHDRPRQSARYVEMLRSIPELLIGEPVLRIRAVLAFCIFGSFSCLWTALVLPLSAPPYSMSPWQVGLFGLAGVAGAMAAKGAGKLADKGLGERTTTASLALLSGSWIPIAFLQLSLAALVVGIVLLDLAIQAVHVSNQSALLTARPQAESRLIAAYMLFYSAGSAVGAIAATTAFAHTGWIGVCVLGAAFSIGGLVYWVRKRPEGQANETTPAF